MAVANAAEEGHDIVDIQEFEVVSDGFSEASMKRAVKAAAVSYLSKAEPGLTPYEDAVTVAGIEDTRNEFSTKAKIIQFFDKGDEKGRDDAIFIEDSGQCFVAFQASTNLTQDVLQNVNLLKETLCKGENECCEFRSGFVNGWKLNIRQNLLKKSRTVLQDATKMMFASLFQVTVKEVLLPLSLP